MDILSDVSINGSLTVNKDLNVTGTSVHQGLLAVNSAIFASTGFGFNVGSVDITMQTLNFNGSCSNVVSIPNVYICGIVYRVPNSNSWNVVRTNAISQTKYLDINVPNGCQKFFITETKGTFLPSIMFFDNNAFKEVKMDLCVEPMCVDGVTFFCVSASRTSTDARNYRITMIE